jgi:hypothetical protein
MSTGAMYRAAVEAEGRIMATLTRLRYAQRDVAARGLAYDSTAGDARQVYADALVQLGVSRDEIAGLNSYTMEKMLKCMPPRGSRSPRSTAMAFDSAPKNDALAGILQGISRPVDLSDQ